MLHELLQIYDQSRTNLGEPDCTWAETLVFNEGWLLRGILQAWQHPAQPNAFAFGFLPFPEGVRVYSEAQLYTPFKPRFQGDPLAEGHTHVDGIVGDFQIVGTKSGVALLPQWRYLAVLEAKMYSPLSGRVSHAPGYDQVSRTVACMIHAMLQAGPVEGGQAHLVVLYPKDNGLIQADQYTMEKVEARVAERVQSYLGAVAQRKPVARFFDVWRAVLPHIQIQFLTWEQVVADIVNDEVQRFYDLCLRFNRPQGKDK